MPQMNPDLLLLRLQSHVLQETTANALEWRICLEDVLQTSLLLKAVGRHFKTQNVLREKESIIAGMHKNVYII